MDDARVRCIIGNAQRIASRRYRGVVLWALVGDLFGYGCTSATELCKRVGLDPHQLVGRKRRIESQGERHG